MARTRPPPAVILSRRCTYAVRCALHVAGAPDGAYTPVREVSAALGIPHPFLAKLAQTLTQAGILRAAPGIGGGIALARPASRITLKEVVLAVDGPALFEACVLRLPGCSDAAPCPLHARWMPARGQIERMFGGATLDAVAAAVRAGGLRLTDAPGVAGA